MDERPIVTPAKSGLVATLIVGVLFFAFILGGVTIPQLFATPLVADGLFSFGMLAGVVLVLVIVALAAIYTRGRDRGERE